MFPAHSDAVGSRLGNNLALGAIFTEASELVGVEVEEFFAAESASMLATCEEHLFPGGARGRSARVVHDDIAAVPELLRGADVVIFFNPFEQLNDREKHQELLLLVASETSRPGQIIVSVPSLYAIYQRAGCALDLITGTTKNCVDLGRWYRELGSVDDAFVYEIMGNAVL